MSLTLWTTRWHNTCPEPSNTLLVCRTRLELPTKKPLATIPFQLLKILNLTLIPSEQGFLLDNLKSLKRLPRVVQLSLLVLTRVKQLQAPPLAQSLTTPTTSATTTPMPKQVQELRQLSATQSLARVLVPSKSHLITRQQLTSLQGLHQPSRQDTSPLLKLYQWKLTCTVSKLFFDILVVNQ
jgi:hypothetical protein